MVDDMNIKSILDNSDTNQLQEMAESLKIGRRNTLSREQLIETLLMHQPQTKKLLRRAKYVNN
jgi:hypothetical protein